MFVLMPVVHAGMVIAPPGLEVACFGISLMRGCLLFIADFLLGVVIGTQCCYFLSVDLDFSVLLMYSHIC